MRTQRWKETLALALMAGFAAACETGTEPTDGPAFDAEAALEDYQALDTLLASGPMAAFRAMARGVTFASFGEEVEFAAGVASELELLEDSSGPETLAARIARMASGLGSEVARNPIISSFRRGKTFVYDPALGRYVIDQERTGAPETGVRFILYEPGPGGKPNVEREIGHADLVDEGDGSEEEIALRLVVVVDDTTILEYRTTVDVLADGGRVTVEGFVQGDLERLDFAIQVHGSAGADGSTMDISFQMEIADRDFLISGSVHGVDGESGVGGEIDLTVRHRTDSFAVLVSGTDDTIDGTFFLNGELFATVQGDPDSPTLAGASGEELTWAEMLVLRQIIDSSEDVFDFFEDLLDPVDELVILALIL
jgi:hypothetical protein